MCADHFVASTDENGYSSGIFALLDNQHAILCRAEGNLLHQASCAQLLWCELTEPRHDAASCGYCYQLHRNHKRHEISEVQRSLFKMVCVTTL